MLRDLWDHRQKKAAEHKTSLKRQVQEIEAKIESLVDRTQETSSATMIARYKERLRDLEQDNAVLAEKAALPAKPQQTFERTSRTAMDFLPNPFKLWNSSRYEDKRPVLKLPFSDELRYKRMRVIEPPIFRYLSSS